MRQTFGVVFMVLALASTAWAGDGFLTDSHPDSHEKISQTKTQWQVMAEKDVESKNDRWGRMENQFQPGNPPSQS